MLRLKLMATVLAALIVVQGVWTATAGQTPTKKDPVAEKAKELPKEIKIPEVRTDKVLLFQEQQKTVQLEQQAAIDRFRASEEWKALEARQKQSLDKLEAELRSALSLAGVEEKDYPKYKYDQVALKFTLQPEPKPEVKK